MHAALGLQIAESVIAGNHDHRAFDSGLVIAQHVHDVGFKAVPLAPAQIHAQEHLRPILRLRAARARVDGKNRVVGVKLAAQHLAKFHVGDMPRQRVRRRRNFREKRRFFFLFAEFDERGQIVMLPG